MVIWDSCCMCKNSEDKAEHLLLNCSVARDLWYLAFALFRVSWDRPKTTVVQKLAYWQGRFHYYRGLKVLKPAPLCILLKILFMFSNNSIYNPCMIGLMR